MKRRRSLSILTAVVLSGSFATAAVGAGLPSWAKTKAGAARWKILANFADEAALDAETGLVWELNPITSTMPHLSAAAYCANQTFGGRRGFRLPTAAEFSSIADNSQMNLLVEGAPISIACETGYWTSTYEVPSPTATAVYYGVFRTGTPGEGCGGTIGVQFESAAGSQRVLCVRGPGGY